VGSAAERALSLDEGADDINKPFEPAELSPGGSFAASLSLTGRAGGLLIRAGSWF
jgi:hypothetical protein